MNFIQHLEISQINYSSTFTRASIKLCAKLKYPTISLLITCMHCTIQNSKCLTHVIIQKFLLYTSNKASASITIREMLALVLDSSVITKASQEQRPFGCRPNAQCLECPEVLSIALLKFWRAHTCRHKMNKKFQLQNAAMNRKTFFTHYKTKQQKVKCLSEQLRQFT